MEGRRAARTILRNRDDRRHEPGQVTLPASRSVRTLLLGEVALRWCRARVNVSVRDPATVQLTPWIRNVTITNGLAAGGDQRSRLRAVQVAAWRPPPMGPTDSPKPAEHDG
jgi:hypothetical protein